MPPPLRQPPRTPRTGQVVGTVVKVGCALWRISALHAGPFDLRRHRRSQTRNTENSLISAAGEGQRPEALLRWPQMIAAPRSSQPRGNRVTGPFVFGRAQQVQTRSLALPVSSQHASEASP